MIEPLLLQERCLRKVMQELEDVDMMVLASIIGKQDDLFAKMCRGSAVQAYQKHGSPSWQMPLRA